MSHRESASHVHVAPSEARDALVALRNVEHLTKSPRVGHSVVVDLLPELRVGLLGLDAFFREMQRAGESAKGCGVGPLALESLTRVTEAVEGVAVAKMRSAASARLRLERTLAEDVPKLEGCVELCEVWARASADLRTELTLRDVVGAALEPARAADSGVVRVVVPEDPLPIFADAGIVVWLLRCALADRARGVLVARASDRGPELVCGDVELAAEGVPMVRRVAPPKVVYPDALARIAERAHVRLVAAETDMTLGFEAPRSARDSEQ